MDNPAAPLSQNEILEQTSFLYGANAAYIEDLQAKFQNDPASVDPEWQAFFNTLSDDAGAVKKTASGASWKNANWPVVANGDLISALDGNWGVIDKVVGDKIKAKAESAPKGSGAPVSETQVQTATRDSVRALMMIRAYRMRGHLHANLDPLGSMRRRTMRNFIRNPTGLPPPITTARYSSTTCSAWNLRRCTRCSPC